MEVKWSNECTYLGIKLCSDRKFKCCGDERRRKFCASVNSVISKSYMSEKVVAHVVKMQFLPILTYSCCVWKLNNREVKKLSVYFNSAYRKMFCYKPCESVKCLLYFLTLLLLDMFIQFRKVCFINECMVSCKKIVNLFGLMWCRERECRVLYERYNLRSLNVNHVKEILWCNVAEYVGV